MQIIKVLIISMNTFGVCREYVVPSQYISRTGVPSSLLHAAFVSSSHTRPDCACRLFCTDECVLNCFVFVIVGRALEVLL